MRDHGAIVQPATDIAKLSLQWELLDAREERTLAEIRVGKGKLLIEARKAFPRTGNNGGWSKLLAKWKVDRDTALRYMKLAGHVESAAATSAESEDDELASGKKSEVNIPTYAAAGIIKHSAPKRPAPVADDEPLAAAERQDLVERLDREAEERRLAALAPLRMEARETAVSRVLAWLERSIEMSNQLAADGIHMTDCTTSAPDLERVKTRALTLFGILESELTSVDVNTVRPVAPKNQLSLLTGGKKE